MRIGDVARAAGVTPRTVRFYELSGLIPPGVRANGGHHRYDGEAVQRVRKIGQLKALGLSLDEIGTVIELYFVDPTLVAAKRSVLRILRQHLADADARVSALQTFRDELQIHVDRFEHRLDQNDQEERWS